MSILFGFSNSLFVSSNSLLVERELASKGRLLMFFRSFNFSEDTARGTADALFMKSADSRIMNIGNSKEPINLIDLANLVIRICGKEEEIKVEVRNSFNKTDRISEREIHQRYCDTSLAEELIGYIPKVGLEEGIRKIIDNGVFQKNWQTSEKKYLLDEI